MMIKKRKKGSVFLLSMIFVVTVFISLTAVLTQQIVFHKMNKKNINRTIALYNAESGIQLALHELKHKSISSSPVRWSGWSISGSIYSITKGGMTYNVKIVTP